VDVRYVAAALWTSVARLIHRTLLKYRLYGVEYHDDMTWTGLAIKA
jgi:hypothetical protein